MLIRNSWKKEKRKALIERSSKPWANTIHAVMIQKGTRKGCALEMLCESLRHILQSSVDMVVRHSPAGRPPDMLLRVQVWRCCWKIEDFQARIGAQAFPHLRATMPRCPIP